jgi:hypothetical protein
MFKKYEKTVNIFLKIILYSFNETKNVNFFTVGSLYSLAVFTCDKKMAQNFICLVDEGGRTVNFRMALKIQ